jgi:hypothetical protein
MADFMLKRGDTAPSLIAVLRDKDGNPVNLTSATVQFVMRATGTTTAPTVDAPMTVASDQVGNKGQVSYDWEADDTATPGTYSAEFVVTWPSGTEQTFPTTGFVSVVINDDLQSHLIAQARSATPEPRSLVLTSDALAKATIARKTAATDAPVLTDADLDELVKYAKRPDGGYNTNRAAAEGWRWKAARAASGFRFTADGVQVDKSELMANCQKMVDLYSRGQVRSVKAETGLMPFEWNGYL